MSPYYSDDAVTLHHGPALDVLATLPDGSANCIVTSPPYFGLRSYLPADHPDKHREQGTEASPAEFIEGMRAVFAEARRVLAKDGTLWVNIGDSYSGKRTTSRGSNSQFATRSVALHQDERPHVLADRSAKNLLGIPWRLAFALQDDGWILRNDIVWSKPNGMPESVTDRLAVKHEYVFMFAKSRRYWFDLDPIREPLAKGDAGSEYHSGKTGLHQLGRSSTAPRKAQDDKGRNPGTVWHIPTTPFPGAHYAVMAPALAERCILSGCKPCGTVLDPFSGAGTTGMVANRHGRRYVGIDLDADALDLSLKTRLAQGAMVDMSVTE